ncbi:hypothetical protein BMETH_817_1 [methanotrophic bacterial endosymbiont of Bathymodiolus sp.]|nr:hypothetical protein BMETH_817_1 [methanotrophic bacterial endosymbiont of Bathymodiolus sp.]
MSVHHTYTYRYNRVMAYPLVLYAIQVYILFRHNNTLRYQH